MKRIGYGVDQDDGVRVVVCAHRRRGRTVFDSPRVGPDVRIETGSGFCPVAAALSSGQAVLRLLSAPFSRPSKAVRVLPSLLEAGLPFSLEQCIALFPEVRRSGPASVAALGAAALKSSITVRREALERAGVPVTRLDHEGIALWTRSLADEPPSAPDEPRAVVYVSPTRISLALGRGPVLEAAYGTARGSGEAPSGARRALQAWRKSASEHVRGFWAGPTAEDATECAALEAELSRTGPFRFVSHEDPSVFLARALAARAVENPADGFFLTGELEPPALRKAAEIRLRRAALFLLVSGVLLCVAAGGWRRKMARVEQDVLRNMNEWARETTGAVTIPMGFEKDRVQEHLREQRAAAEPLAVFFEPSLVDAVSRLVERAYQLGIGVEQIRADPKSLEARGRAADWDAPRELTQRLQALGYGPELERRDAGVDERIPFTITGRRP